MSRSPLSPHNACVRPAAVRDLKAALPLGEHLSPVWEARAASFSRRAEKMDA